MKLEVGGSCLKWSWQVVSSLPPKVPAKVTPRLASRSSGLVAQADPRQHSPRATSTSTSPSSLHWPASL